MSRFRAYDVIQCIGKVCAKREESSGIIYVGLKILEKRPKMTARATEYLRTMSEKGCSGGICIEMVRKMVGKSDIIL